MKKRIVDWWTEFWWGPPCKHGVYGRSYRDRIVIECRACWQQILQDVTEEQEAEEVRVLRSNPAFQELERRVNRLTQRIQDLEEGG